MKAPSRMRGMLAAGALLAVAACSTVAAHELQENRATLVQRDTGFVSVTLYIDLPAALHRTLAPRRSFEEFALAHANLPPAAFKAKLVEATGRMEAEMRVTTAKGSALAFEQWVWPDAARVQAALLERLMDAVVARGSHPQVAPWEVHAELHSTVPITALRVQFTPALGRVMVVSYRPRQVWVDMNSVSSTITF